MISWFLNPKKWDTCVDAAGNVAVCSEPYRIAQDVATACRTFVQAPNGGPGDIWWNQSAGVPNAAILSENVSLAYVAAVYQTMALTVPGCTSALAILVQPGPSRKLTGQIQVNGTMTVAV